MNVNGTDEESQSLVAEIFKGVVFSGITFATIVGNLLALLALVLTRKWHTRYLIASLACTDLSLGALVMPFTTATSVKPNWLFGYRWCQAQGGLGFLLCQVSVITLACVSVERYVLFTKPNLHFKWFQNNSEYIRYLITTTWIYGGLWTFLAWQTTRFSYAKELLNCAVEWKYNRAFTMACGLITSCFPICLILFCNFKVLKILRKWNISNAFSHAENLKKNVTEVKISRMILVVVIAFLVCWTPYSVGGICYLLPHCNWPDEFFVVSVFLCLFNSCINPIIYGTFDRRFRKTLKLLILRKLYWKPHKTISMIEGSKQSKKS